MIKATTLTLSEEAKQARNWDIATGKIPHKVIKSMEKDPRALEIINALYEVITKKS